MQGIIVNDILNVKGLICNVLKLYHVNLNITLITISMLYYDMVNKTISMLNSPTRTYMNLLFGVIS